jgi:hypothetical protein
MISKFHEWTSSKYGRTHQPWSTFGGGLAACWSKKDASGEITGKRGKLRGFGSYGHNFVSLGTVSSVMPDNEFHIASDGMLVM